MDGNRELKLTINNKWNPRILNWLNTFCQPDPEYPYSTISSLYYDTYNWDCAAEKVNSYYLKTKYRLRWYTLFEQNENPNGAIFSEVKHRIGSTRKKFRLPSSLTLNDINYPDFNDSRFSIFVKELRAQGLKIQKTITPVYVVRYCRHRFVDSLYSSRICLDANIEVPRINCNRIPCASSLPMRLETAVVEIKGSNENIPPYLQNLISLGCRKASFSKYEACYQKLLNMLN